MLKIIQEPIGYHNSDHGHHNLSLNFNWTKFNIFSLILKYRKIKPKTFSTQLKFLIHQLRVYFVILDRIDWSKNFSTSLKTVVLFIF
jgi:hypothetical protein